LIEVPVRDRGRDTSNALTEVRAVLSRAKSTRKMLERPTEFTDQGGSWNRRLADPDAEEMRKALDGVIKLLEPWQRTGRPLRSKEGGTASW
jgi:hypothetical protein